MTGKRKICVITGTRAEYGLLYWLMKEIEDSNDLELQLVVTGMHLSPEFGLTYQQIEDDGFVVKHKVEMLLSSDTPVGISKSMGLAMIGFADVFADLLPDLLVVLGDRFEIFAAASAALVCKVPIAHIHGGEITEGAFDEAFRHSITKMAHLHFTATEEYRNRVIQLGEQPDNVFNVGAIGIDNIKRFKLLSREDFEESVDLKLAKRNLLITFHPVTLEEGTAAEQFANLLQVLDELEETHLFFTKANADTDGRIINEMIDNFVSRNADKAIAHTSLGQIRYLSALQYMDGVVGNSSSGIIEAPSFQIGTVNIGDRQKGRIQASTIISCSPSLKSLRKALLRLDTTEFREHIRNVKNPYEFQGTLAKIINVIGCNIGNIPTKKTFYDLADQVK